MKFQTKEKKIPIFVLSAILIIAASILFAVSGHASNVAMYPQAALYKAEESALFDINGSEQVDNLSLGNGKIGTFYIDSDTIDSQKSLGGWTAYSSDDDVTLGYNYTGNYQTDDEYTWNLASAAGKSVNGINTGKIKLGAFVVERSYDGENWETAAEPIVNLFGGKTDLSSLYTIPAEDCLKGMYYRVTIAYEMQKRIEGSKNYKYAYCMEVYSFFIGNDSNPVILHDVITWADLSESTEVREGFVIDFPDMSDSVLLIDQDGNTQVISDPETIYEEGAYTVKTITPFGTIYTQTVTVTDGLKTAAVQPSVFANSNINEGYTTDHAVSGDKVFGYPSYTGLSVAQVSDSELSVSYRNYGVTGESVYLLMSLRDDEELAANGWKILNDTWGMKAKETINGTNYDRVCTGELIIQTSSDGKNWKYLDEGNYADGLYTTDFGTYYSGRDSIMIYMPDGNAVLNGLYVRIYYAYEVGAIADNTTKYRVMEEYNLYLCRNELDAVTIHNLTAEDQIEEMYGDYDEITADAQKHSETMQSGDCTVTGFTIDISGNPTVTYTVTKDGMQLDPYPAGSEYRDDGKYEIELQSVTGETKEIVIYVDTRSEEDALNSYFGDSDGNIFITGKRIYSDGDIPAYEAGETHFHIESEKDGYLPVTGELVNMTTGETIELSSASGSIYRDIDTAGEYQAVFTNNPNYGTESASGDIRVFTFKFNVIENGTAPGPQVNQEILDEYSHSTVVDSYPIYYGVTVPSAQKGNITRAFATESAALDYARNYESGIVEVQDDGTYRYTGSLPGVTQKVTYEANIDVMDAVEYFARQSVERLCFDPTDPASVLTLDQETLSDTENLRTLELNNSVVVFADDEQKAALTDLDALPIINDKICHFLQDGASGEITNDTEDFEFIKDENGYDSAGVIITDAASNEIEITYGQSVESQLAANGCESGIITINEQTVYGDSTEYKAVYIAESDNTAAVTLNYYADGAENNVILTQDDDGTTITADSFRITDITDELDPYSLVIINDGSTEYSYAIDDLPDTVWTADADYQIKITNRLGYCWSFTVSVSGAYYSEISFAGEGTDNMTNILTYYGAKNVELEAPSLYGYDFAGYTDEDGTVYTEEIAQILFKGMHVLEAQWIPKSVEVILQDQDGNELDTVTVSYGDTYTLPEEDAENGYKFDGWTQDGEKLEDNKLTITTTDTIVVQTITSRAEAKPENTTQEMTTSGTGNKIKKASSGSSIWVITVAAIIIITATVTVIIVKKKNKIRDTSNKDHMSEGDKH